MRELDVALEAVEQASQFLVKEYERFHAIADAPADITTEADRQAQEILLQHLRRHFPNDAYCAEEATASVKDTPNVGPRLWVIDPIDGTRGFAQKIGEFSIMVGFVRDSVIQLGIVAQPVHQKITYATLGGGCWRHDAGKDPVRCQVTNVDQLEKSALTQSRSKKPGVRSPMVEAINPARIVESYSAGIKLALVARGDADIYLNDYTAFHDWDICAGHILVSEAGGKVTGLHGQVLQYGLPGAWQKFGLVATNGKIHAEALCRLEKFTLG